MVQFDVEALLVEISPDAPCGEDISYDADFLELERLAQGKAETQVGDYIQESEEPDWKQVYKLSLELLGRSRDLRLILYLTAASLRLTGLSRLRDGLALLRGVVERYWDHLFPQLDPDDDNDPLERMNIISALSPPLDGDERSGSNEIYGPIDGSPAMRASGCPITACESASHADGFG